MLTKDAVERERYEARQKAMRDQMSLVQEAKEQGRQEGRQEGIIDRIHLCQRFLKQPVTPRDELASRPLEELRRLAEELENAMFRR